MRFLVIAAACFFIGPGHLYSLEMDDLDTELTYLSPTRLKQSPHDIPASVSKITQATIADLQIHSLPELLKYVAGMISVYASGHDPRINYHGTNGLAPRRMQILLDGVSLYRPGYTSLNWAALPVSIHDVDAVEITRSPSTASYDVSSMMAVINIKTKDPYDVGALALYSRDGSRSLRMRDLQHGGTLNDKLRYRLSLSTAEDAGYDKNATGDERRDGSESVRASGKMIYQLSDHTQANAHLSYSDTLAQQEHRDAGQGLAPDMMMDSLFAAVEIKHDRSKTHSLKLRADYTAISQQLVWQSCYPAIMFSQNLRALYQQNPDYAQALLNQQVPSGGSAADNTLRDAVLLDINNLGAMAFEPLCGELNENSTEKRLVFELQDTLNLSHRLRVVSGLGATYETLDSETFLNGERQAEAYRVFTNGEYRLSDWVANMGVMVEHESLVDKMLVSPRIGINYRLNANKTLRFVVSKGLRTPDLFEQYLDWNYLVRDLHAPTSGNASSAEGQDAYFFSHTNNTHTLEAEEILAREVSLYSRQHTHLTQGSMTQVYNLKVFYNSLCHLVSEKLHIHDAHLSNHSEVTLKGFEIDSTMSLKGVIDNNYLTRLDLHMNYAYIDNKTDAFYEKTLHARHSGAAYAIGHFTEGWRASLAYHGHSGVYGESFNSWEVGLGKHYRLGKGGLALNGKVVYWPDSENSFIHHEHDSKMHNTNDRDTAIYLSMHYMLK
ncbi:MAG: TonB-dependent receptor [Cellvibrionaceae bacterium]|nr:TonB-dependent receptor [Cellvibrionaceae bacterium]